MLTTRGNIVGSGSRNAYICTSCRIKAQWRQLHSDDRPLITNSCNKAPSNPSNAYFSYDAQRGRRSRFGRRGSRGVGNGWRAEIEVNGRARWPSRTIHTSSQKLQQTAILPQSSERSPASPDLYDASSTQPGGIRAQFRRWNDLHGQEHSLFDPEPAFDDDAKDQPTNTSSRLQDQNPLSRLKQERNDQAAEGYHAPPSDEEFENNVGQDIFLHMGDLVEIYFPLSERESLLAVFVRRVAGRAQCYGMNGRWIHVMESHIPYSIPNWISPELLKPLLSHLPSAEDLEDYSALAELAKIEDLSIPREVAAPVVSRLVDFHNESQEIYRKHAGALDAAHDILAHPMDLRYGSLTSAATALLKTPKDHLSLPALFAVRKAISNADFGFNIDRTTHRMTGYIQIISKAQVRAIDRVRDWIRQWQDHIVKKMQVSDRQGARRIPSRECQIVLGYIEKVKGVIQKSRETRMPTPYATVGPSSVDKTSTRQLLTPMFSPEEQEITRFMEAWSVNSFFLTHPRLASMPPLLLKATGLYPDFELDMSTGFMFLQEIGTFTPHDNKRRFDANLLLPSSHLSRPLIALGEKIDQMVDSTGFSDSMADLRHDWKDLPVFCIDSANAQEIDDGISVEEADRDANGKQQYWVHVHIANPTAFFTRDHPIAKMARHMGETVYMPEHNFAMIPDWASQNHFSLGKDRPCLTVSAKLNEDGNTAERKITNGIVRNTFALAPDEVGQLLGLSDNQALNKRVLTVGRPRPPPSQLSQQLLGINPSSLDRVGEREVEDLRILERLSLKRLRKRKEGGGIFFDIPRPEVSVWTGGRAGLRHINPYYLGSRIIEGDPSIEYRTEEVGNWFAPRAGAGQELVREMMLLACQTCAEWCAERRIPIIYRGTTHRPDGGLTPREFLDRVIVPEVGEGGEIPMHLGMRYMETLGPSILSTIPLRHDTVGMDHYSKVTSPLRRYGDMILHWQVEAALRHEVRTGRSLVVDAGAEADRSFLPFSRSGLDVIARGLRPRERTVMLAKRHTERFWFLVLLMRKHYFKETGVEDGDGNGGFHYGESLRVMLTTLKSYDNIVTGLSLDLNFYVQVLPSDSVMKAELRQGDVWECKIAGLNIYNQTCHVEPLRLLERPEL